MVFKSLYFLSNLKLCCYSHKTGKIISFSLSISFVWVSFPSRLRSFHSAHTNLFVLAIVSTFIEITTVQYSIRSSPSEIVYLFLHFFAVAVVISIENWHVLVTYSNPHMVQSTFGTHQINCIASEIYTLDLWVSFVCRSLIWSPSSVWIIVLLFLQMFFFRSLTCKFNTQGHSFVWMVVCVEFIRMLQNCFVQFSESHRRDERRRIERNKYNVYW